MLVGLDHIAVDDGVCGVCAGEGCDCKVIKEGENEGNRNAERRHGEQRKQDDVDRRDEHDPENAHKVSLYAKNAEDQRVFEDLFQRHIKGNEQQIDVKPHKEIENAERHDGKIADIRPERAGHSHKIGKIKHQQKDCNDVDQPKQKALLEVSANGVGIIRREKDGLAAHHAAQNVGRAHVLPAPRHQ